jgi:hypothetical protein
MNTGGILEYLTIVLTSPFEATTFTHMINYGLKYGDYEQFMKNDFIRTIFPLAIQL